MNNEKKYQDYKKKKLYKYLIIVCSILTILLEIIALFQKISLLWGLIPFSLTYYFKCLYQEVSFKELLKRKKTNKEKKSK